MISRLKNGDILISLEDVPRATFTKEENFEHLISNAEHGMVYRHGDKGDVVVHASQGKFQTGVRNHPLTKALTPQHPLGICSILRYEDDILRSNLANAADRFDPKLTPEELAARPIIEDIVRLPTPFIDFFERERDEPDRLEGHELFRAFRAHMRNHAQPKPLPLSNNRGVSCSNFVGYAAKVAIIDRIFPDGLPPEIDMPLHVEYILMKVGINSDKPIKKLKDIDSQFFEDFKKVVKEKIATSKVVPEELKADLFNVLCMPVKGYGIIDFCNHVKAFPDLFSLQGHLLLVREFDNHGKEMLNPYVIDQKAYQIIVDHYKSMGKNKVPLAIPKEELLQLSSKGLSFSQPAEPKGDQKYIPSKSSF